MDNSEPLSLFTKVSRVAGTIAKGAFAKFIIARARQGCVLFHRRRFVQVSGRGERLGTAELTSEKLARKAAEPRDRPRICEFEGDFNR